MARRTSKKYEEVITFLRENPGSSRNEIAVGTGTSVQTVCSTVYRGMTRGDMEVCEYREEPNEGGLISTKKVGLIALSGEYVPTLREFATKVSLSQVFVAGEKTYIDGALQKEAVQILDSGI